MSQKWNLQDIRPAEPRKRRVPPQGQMKPAEAGRDETVFHNSREDVPNIVIEDGTQKGSKTIVIAIALFVVIVGGAIGLSALLGKTELTIFPENREPTISAEFTAFPDQRADALSYEIMTLETTSESQVTASGQVEAQEQATGVIEIIKTTPGAERLIKNTRFRSPDGLVFRIQESVVVPGAVSGDAGRVPGRIQAEVFADEIGEEYNLAAGTRFDIPGFEEGGFDELFNSIYAENPQSFTGGFDGLQFQIDDNELATARQALQVQLRDNLLSRIETEKPSEFIAFPGSIAITYNQLEPVQYGQDLVTIREQAVLQIPLFQARDFGTFLAGEAVATYDGGPVRVDDPMSLNFNYTNPTTSASVIANEPSLTFSLTGRPLLIWEYDATKLAEQLAGLPKTAINNAIGAYPGIEAARVRITPFWQRSFPEDPTEIIIIEELQQETE